MKVIIKKDAPIQENIAVVKGMPYEVIEVDNNKLKLKTSVNMFSFSLNENICPCCQQKITHKSKYTSTDRSFWIDKEYTIEILE